MGHRSGCRRVRGGESPVIGQAGIVVFAAGKQKELAAEFVAHMTTKRERRRRGAVLPAGAQDRARQRRASSSPTTLIPRSQMKVVGDAIAKGKVLPAHQKSPQILAAMKPRIDALARQCRRGSFVEGRLHRHPAACSEGWTVARHDGGPMTGVAARREHAPWLTL